MRANYIFATGDKDFLRAEHCDRRFFVLATTALTVPRAFENGKPGWKMDGDKLALDGSGNPIYVNANGDEQSVKGDTIASLNNEAKTHRTAKETAEANLAKYRGADGKLIDPEQAIKAIKTVADIDSKTLIDAGKVDEVRQQMASQYNGQLGEKDTKIGELERTISNMRIDSVFKGSEFVADRVAIPREFFESTMRGHFKDEDGKIVAYDRSGNPIYSKKNAGEFAAPDEALELLVEMHPQKDSILKANSGGGSGNNGGGGSRGGGRTITRDAFSQLTPAEQSSIATKGEIQIVD